MHRHFIWGIVYVLYLCHNSVISTILCYNFLKIACFIVSSRKHGCSSRVAAPALDAVRNIAIVRVCAALVFFFFFEFAPTRIDWC